MCVFDVRAWMYFVCVFVCAMKGLLHLSNSFQCSRGLIWLDNMGGLYLGMCK